MTKKAQVWTVCIVVALGMSAYTAYMIFSSTKDGSALEYFRDVDKALGDLVKLKNRRIRLHGNVIKGTIQKKKGSLAYRFAIHARGRWVEVKYKGLMPDTFKDCAEVVAKGRFSPDGKLFAADEITAKCPSKYDEKQRTTGCGDDLRPLVVAQRKSN
ncbi:MAG: cytochrome c maturation protein CcmE [Myxococcales bacterium]|nr:cytochrome c maturation protein CcmE [Myxococcales bacterium]